VKDTGSKEFNPNWSLTRSNRNPRFDLLKDPGNTVGTKKWMKKAKRQKNPRIDFRFTQ